MELRFQCPFCVRSGQSPDRKRHLHVNPTLNVAHCFRCGYGLRGHAKEMCEREGLDIEASLWEYVETVGAPEPCTLPREYSQNWTTTLWGPRALEYLLNRGLSAPLIHAYEFGHCDSGMYALRIVIPVYEQGVLVYFQARDWTEEQEPKYHGPSGKGIEPLFNLDRAATKKVLVLVEGIFDALRLPEYGVALMGKELSEKKCGKVFATHPNAVLILLDNDAHEYAERIRDQLVGAVPLVSIIPIPGIKDLGAAPLHTVTYVRALCQQIEAHFGQASGTDQ